MNLGNQKTILVKLIIVAIQIFVFVACGKSGSSDGVGVQREELTQEDAKLLVAYLTVENIAPKRELEPLYPEMSEVDWLECQVIDETDVDNDGDFILVRREANFNDCELVSGITIQTDIDDNDSQSGMQTEFMDYFFPSGHKWRELSFGQGLVEYKVTTIVPNVEWRESQRNSQALINGIEVLFTELDLIALGTDPRQRTETGTVIINGRSSKIAVNIDVQFNVESSAYSGTISATLGSHTFEAQMDGEGGVNSTFNGQAIDVYNLY